MCKFAKEEAVRRQELNRRRDSISRQQPCLAEAFGGCFVQQDQLLLKLQPATTIFQAVDSISGNDGIMCWRMIAFAVMTALATAAEQHTKACTCIRCCTMTCFCVG